MLKHYCKRKEIGRDITKEYRPGEVMLKIEKKMIEAVSSGEG